MAQDLNWCNKCKGRVPKFYCSTDEQFLCVICTEIDCYRLAHNWREMTDAELKDSIFMRGRDTTTDDGSVSKPK